MKKARPQRKEEVDRFGRASVMPMRVFAGEHITLNRTLKLSSGGLYYLTQQVAAGIAPPLGDVMSAYSDSWKTAPVVSLGVAERDECMAELARMGIMRVTSSFDAFITSIESELTRASVKPARTRVGGHDLSDDGADGNDRPPRFTTFVSTWGLTLEPIESVWRIAEVLTVLRNCCAHRAGIASPSLESELETESFRKSLEQYPRSRASEWTPELPGARAGEPIPILPQHVVFASDVFLRLAKAIDRAVVQAMGEKGMLISAIAHFDRARDLANGTRFKSPQAAIQFVLSTMRVSRLSQVELIALLKRYGLWKDVMRLVIE